MVYASTRTRTALAGVLLAVGLLGVLRFADAQPPAKDNAPKAADAKSDAAAPQAKIAALKMTIVAKDPDVAEMAKVINEKLEAGWKANKLSPSRYIDDYDFIRRASLDIIGRIATPKEISDYMKHPEATRRSQLIDDLLKHEDYARHWANLWSNWLLTRAGDFGRGKYHDQMTVWLEDQFAQNKPYHEWVSKMMTASGSNAKNGAVNFFLAHLGERIPADKRAEQGDYEMVPLTSRITRVFLGTQVQCAQCHAHPFFASLKQESFWGVNAFLRQIRQRGMVMNNQRMMALPDITLTDDTSVNTDANVLFEMRNGKMKYWHAEFLPPTGKERGVRLDPKKTGIERREELARFLVDHEMFTKAIVNRMWGLFFGRGFVNPIDDFNDNNQPSNPELMNALAERFKHYNYDIKKLIRWMAHANAYHLSHVANKSNDKVDHEALFSRMVMKSLTPEQLFESLTTATQSDKGMTSEQKRTQKNEWLGQLITNFGDDEGNEVTFNGTIVQALLMMNGKNINDAIASPKGAVATAMATKGTADRVIRDLYLAALNRPPKKTELIEILKKIQLRPGFRDSAKAQYEDLYWALLNSNEFIINH